MQKLKVLLASVTCAIGNGGALMGNATNRTLLH